MSNPVSSLSRECKLTCENYANKSNITIVLICENPDFILIGPVPSIEAAITECLGEEYDKWGHAKQ